MTSFIADSILVITKLEKFNFLHNILPFLQVKKKYYQQKRIKTLNKKTKLININNNENKHSKVSIIKHLHNVLQTSMAVKQSNIIVALTLCKALIPKQGFQYFAHKSWLPTMSPDTPSPPPFLRKRGLTASFPHSRLIYSNLLATSIFIETPA